LAETLCLGISVIEVELLGLMETIGTVTQTITIMETMNIVISALLRKLKNSSHLTHSISTLYKMGTELKLLGYPKTIVKRAFSRIGVEFKQLQHKWKDILNDIFSG
jgi:hypothetical protein